MKVLKTIAAVLCILAIAAAAATAESALNEDFTSFGIKSIGIYTEGYEDERVNNFMTAYLNAYASQNVTFFRYTLCDYEGVTPKLTTPGYPVAASSAATGVDEILKTETSEFLEGLAWKTEKITDFNGGSLSDLLENASKKGLDAVMLIRYYSIENYVPIENYRASYGYYSNSYSANIGKIKTGLGLIPAIELYDSKTGVRLWYSAYHTGTFDRDNELAYQSYVDNAEAFFVEGDSPQQKAATKMVKLSLKAGDFPAASASGSRDDAVADAQAVAISGFFWSQDPSHNFYGTLMGLGYTFDYVGNFGLWYVDDDNPDSSAAPELVGAAPNSMMHRFTIPMFTFGFGNITIDPAFYFGFLPEATTAIAYTDYVDDDNNTFTPPVEVAKTGTASVFASVIGMDLALKYYLRFSDTLSAYIGGRATAEAWLISVDSQDVNSYDFKDKVSGLINVEDSFIVNASVIAGIRWDTSTPLELFGMFTPVGPGGTPMISAGLKWHWITFEWVQPHSKNVKVDMRW